MSIYYAYCILNVMNESSNTNRKTITIRESTYERLKDAGRMGDGFDDVISRLLDEHDEFLGGNA